jgi:hypothetical protein
VLAPPINAADLAGAWSLTAVERDRIARIALHGEREVIV